MSREDNPVYQEAYAAVRRTLACAPNNVVAVTDLLLVQTHQAREEGRTEMINRVLAFADELRDELPRKVRENHE